MDDWQPRTVKPSPQGFFSRRTGWTALLMSLALVAIIGLSLSQGSVSINGPELWQAILHRGSEVNQTIIWELRLPRVIAALVVGAALGASGALMQGMLRNGLASPFLLGISAGAGLVAVTLLSLGFWQQWVPLGAWLGAMLTTLFVYLLARQGSTLSVERLLLGGVAVSALFGALQSALLLISDDGRVQSALTWLVGSLNGRGWQEVQIAGPYVLIALIFSCLLASSINLLNLGDDLSVGLGLSPLRARALIGATAALLAAGAVSMAGLIGFVGLIVPHGVRLLVGTDYRVVLPFSAVGGAFVLAFADLLSRLGTVELPVGIVTAFLGSPVFIWLLYRRSGMGGV
ncbi:FecCD family ABC transporter permease [Capilliphycus salinus ALCB114379]|uniref:FecCD family ABC transporter permease n=1 Tax=Capilliphycus salinus TaxID=2768948 RepID=UPI0039A5DC88